MAPLSSQYWVCGSCRRWSWCGPQACAGCKRAAPRWSLAGFAEGQGHSGQRSGSTGRGVSRVVVRDARAKSPGSKGRRRKARRERSVSTSAASADRVHPAGGRRADRSYAAVAAAGSAPPAATASTKWSDIPFGPEPAAAANGTSVAMELGEARGCGAGGNAALAATPAAQAAAATGAAAPPGGEQTQSSAVEQLGRLQQQIAHHDRMARHLQHSLSDLPEAATEERAALAAWAESHAQKAAACRQSLRDAKERQPTSRDLSAANDKLRKREKAALAAKEKLERARADLAKARCLVEETERTVAGAQQAVEEAKVACYRISQGLSAGANGAAASYAGDEDGPWESVPKRGRRGGRSATPKRLAAGDARPTAALRDLVAQVQRMRTVVDALPAVLLPENAGNAQPAFEALAAQLRSVEQATEAACPPGASEPRGREANGRSPTEPAEDLLSSQGPAPMEDDGQTVGASGA